MMLKQGHSNCSAAHQQQGIERKSFSKQHTQRYSRTDSPHHSTVMYALSFVAFHQPPLTLSSSSFLPGMLLYDADTFCCCCDVHLLPFLYCSGVLQLPGFARRAMCSLLGFGYLLTVLHERQLGGQIQFAANALADDSSSSAPSSGNSHMRLLKKISSNGRTGELVVAAAQQAPGVDYSSGCGLVGELRLYAC